MQVSIKILADASLPGLRPLFPAPFSLSLYHNKDQLIDLLPTHDVLLCRSTLPVNAKLLTNSRIQCVATASSGTDHIDSEYLEQRNIRLFDAKGSNARAVADYVVATLAAHQPTGKLAGVIGIGEVGSRVVERLHAAGFKVICFDPLKAPHDKHHHYVTLTELTACDVICIHANLHETAPFPSKHLLNADFMAQLKSGVTLINASRGGIVNENALLSTPTKMTYCTDVYCNEPLIDARIIDLATICTPHIAGHSIEAKQAAIIQISQQLHQYFGFTAPICTIEKHDVTATRPICQTTWQDCVLNIYNPMMETQALKTGKNKHDTFLVQRKAHTQRHDFNRYKIDGLDEQTKLVLGQ